MNRRLLGNLGEARRHSVNLACPTSAPRLWHPPNVQSCLGGSALQNCPKPCSLAAAQAPPGRTNRGCLRPAGQPLWGSLTPAGCLSPRGAGQVPLSQWLGSDMGGSLEAERGEELQPRDEQTSRRNNKTGGEGVDHESGTHARCSFGFCFCISSFLCVTSVCLPACSVGGAACESLCVFAPSSSIPFFSVPNLLFCVRGIFLPSQRASSVDLARDPSTHPRPLP